MGYVQILREFPSRLEGKRRTVRIFTPSLYDRDPSARFGVLYMHDAQNLFDHPETEVPVSWGADSTLERMIDQGRIPPWMIVAIDHDGPGRFAQYSPWPEVRAGVHEGRAEQFGRWLVEELKPWVDQHYRTRTEAMWTGSMGTSLGGLVSLYLNLRFPDVIGRVGALSPSVMWCEEGLFRHWTAHSRKWTRIYLDVGTAESMVLHGVPMPYAERTAAFYWHLKNLGYEHWELKLVVEEGAWHHESDWRRRLPGAYDWLLGSW